MLENKLFHSSVYCGKDMSNGILHYKYIDKYKSKTGKWVYVYSKKVGKGVNNAYHKTSKKYKKITEENMYDTNRSNYNEKIKKIANSKEWKDIIARNDPEYVTKDENGKTIYKIDDYLVKKKHPTLDILDDAANGRDLSLNKITLDSILAGGNDYLKTGLAYVSIVSKVLTEKFKYSQGSYNDVEKQNKQQLGEIMKTGEAFIGSLSSYYNS